jgi:hypothetical protein
VAKLPDSTVLGGVDVASRRPIASYDDTVLAKGDAAMGEAIGGGLQAIGKGAVNFGGAFTDIEVRKQTAERTQARAEALAAKVDLDSRFAQDTNYKDMAPRYEKELQGVVEKAGGLIQTPGNRQRFFDEIKPTVRLGVASALSRARKLEGDTNVGYVLEQGNTLLQRAVSSGDPAIVSQAVQSYNDHVDSLVGRGFRTPEQGMAMKKQFVHDYGRADYSKRVDTDPVGLSANLANPAGTPYEFLPVAEREQLALQARLAVERRQTKQSAAQSEVWERQILDYSAGRGAAPTLEAIDNDPLLTPDRRNALVGRLDQANKQRAQFDQFVSRFNEPTGNFNPYSADDQKGVDQVFQSLGGDLPALQRVVDRTGMVPKSFATKLRGDLVSGDPKRVAAALQIGAGLSARNPAILSAGVQGSKEIEDAVTTFQHRVEDLGMTAEQAAAKHIESLTPEYQAKVKAKVKGEDINEIIKKQVSVDDIRGAFDASWWPGTPQVGFDPGQRKAMYNDYVEVFRDYYTKTGDVEEAKRLAARQLRRVWGVTRVNGSDVVMKYAPELAPAYRGIENVSEHIAFQAIADIKRQTGKDVTADRVQLSPIPGGYTSTAFWGAKPPPYILEYKDENGLWQVLSPGKGFVAWPEPMQQAQENKRRQQFEGRRQQFETFQRDVQDWQSDPLNAPIGPRSRLPGATQVEAAGKAAVAAQRAGFEADVKEQQSFPENTPLNLRQPVNVGRGLKAVKDAATARYRRSQGLPE